MGRQNGGSAQGSFYRGGEDKAAGFSALIHADASACQALKNPPGGSPGGLLFMPSPADTHLTQVFAALQMGKGLA